MAYNYQKEKRAWIIWKEAEEKQLRNLVLAPPRLVRKKPS